MRGKKAAYIHCALLFWAFSTLLSGCRGVSNDGWKPWIGATLIGFSEGQKPDALINAFVLLWDDTANTPIIDAHVTINGTTLGYSPASGGYQAIVTVQPGQEVILHVSTRGIVVEAVGTQFTAYPIIYDPISGAVWEAGSNQNVFWTEGAPSEDAVGQWIAVLDGADPNGALVYPLTDLPLVSRAHTFGAKRLGAGERLILVGMNALYPLTGAAADSVLILSGCACVPVTIRGRYMTVAPKDDRTAQGSTVQYWADVYSYFDGSRETVTESATWTCSDPAVATISNDAASKGLATPEGEGTATVTAEWQELSASTSLTVLPWMIRATATTEGLSDLAASDSLLVAVGRDGTIETSPNRIDWIIQDSGTTAHLNGVTWAGSQFVAVGNDGLVLTSPDAIEWTAQDSGTSMPLTGVAWSGTGLVAVGSDGILSSPDGVDWTLRRDLTQLWSAVASSGTVFVAAGEVGVLHSLDDGATWNSCEGSVSGRSDVGWAGDRFLSVGRYGSLITSTDGVSWSTQTISGTDHIFSAAGTGEHYVITARRTYDYLALILFSDDATAWDTQLAETGTLSRLIWFNGEYVALESGGRIVTIPPPKSAAGLSGRAAAPSAIPSPASALGPMALLRNLLMSRRGIR